jgi:hypothetical protein
MLIPRIVTLAKTSFFAIALLLSSTATAGGLPPFESAARNYRSAVQAFERQVHRLRYIDRYDVMLVERLENAACDFYGTSFRPSDVSRVYYYWHEIEVLQPRVASVIFDRECYPINIELAQCWEQVTCAYNELALCLRPPVIVDRNGRELPQDYHPAVPRRDTRYPPHAEPYHDHHAPSDYHGTIAVPPIATQPFPIGDTRNSSFGGYPSDRYGHQTNRRVDGRDLGAVIISSLLQRAFSR